MLIPVGEYSVIFLQYSNYNKKKFASCRIMFIIIQSFFGVFHVTIGVNFVNLLAYKKLATSLLASRGN